MNWKAQLTVLLLLTWLTSLACRVQLLIRVGVLESCGEQIGRARVQLLLLLCGVFGVERRAALLMVVVVVLEMASVQLAHGCRLSMVFAFGFGFAFGWMAALERGELLV